MKKLLTLACLAALATLVVPCCAQASTPSLASLAKVVAALKSVTVKQHKEIVALNKRLAAAQPVLALAPYVQLDKYAQNGVKGPNIIFSGANVHVVSGSGKSDDNGTLRGLGNLIVGYDAPLSGGPTTSRSGSNNLIVGDWQAFPSYGGFVAGNGNQIAAPYASVSGGAYSTASAEYASVSGGEGNTAGAEFSSVSGGTSNSTTYYFASVSGGQNNQASGDATSISGGLNVSLGTDDGWAAGSLHSP